MRSSTATGHTGSRPAAARAFWTLLPNPAPAELARATQGWDLHPLITTDLTQRRRHPKLERFGEVRYLTVWDIDPRDGREASDAELRFVFDDERLVIVQQGPPEHLRDIGALLTAADALPVRSPVSAVYRVLNAVVADFVQIGADIERELERVEAEVFDSRVHEDYRRIYRLRQRIGTIDRAASGLAEAVRDGRAEIEAATVGETALRPYFRRLVDDVEGVARLAAAEHVALDAVVSSHESNVSTRQNQDMRTISSFAALLAIPTVVAGIYGMNFKNLPLVQWQFGWLVIGLSIVVVDVVAVVLFLRRGWLGKGRKGRAAEDEQ